MRPAATPYLADSSVNSLLLWKWGRHKKPSPGCWRGQGQSTAGGHHSPSLMGSTRSLMAGGQVPTCLPNAFISPCPDFSSALTKSDGEVVWTIGSKPTLSVYAPSDARLTLTCLLGSFIHTPQSCHSELRDLRSRLPFLAFPSFCLQFPLQFSPLRGEPTPGKPYASRCSSVGPDLTCQSSPGLHSHARLANSF